MQPSHTRIEGHRHLLDINSQVVQDVYPAPYQLVNRAGGLPLQVLLDINSQIAWGIRRLLSISSLITQKSCDLLDINDINS